MKCPLCLGVGEIRAAFKPIKMDCFLCNKTGELTDQQWNNYLKGRELRKKRIRAGFLMRDLAVNKGFTPTEISEMELGMRPAPEGLYEFSLSGE